jgi:hypothetical protein
VAACNRLGTAALEAGRHDEARTLFDIQVDLAETALKLADEDADGRLAHAREIAVNNAALAALRRGDCLFARAWLEAAEPTHRATMANRKAVVERCAEALNAVIPTGEFVQYAGHGAFNSLTLRESGDETLQFSAYWMRVGRGPLAEWGPAAIGSLDNTLVDRESGIGRYAGIEDHPCELAIQWVPGGLEIQHTDTPECRMGGMGAELFGKYWRVGEPERAGGD